MRIYSNEFDKKEKIYSSSQHSYKDYYYDDYDDYDEEGYICVDNEYKYRCESHEDFYREEK
ncbi:hypothetical protein IJJ97_03885 [bacterium]|nr:hypothetical protein [bacterium]